MELQTFKHYRSMDIYGNGVGYNVVIVKEEDNGDVYFIKEEDLDQVDVRRMQSILNRRGADNTPLWDVMHQVTLKNGMNALEYFHQMVQIRTSSGQLISPSNTRRGMRQTLNPVNPARHAQPRQPQAAPATPAAQENLQEQATQAAQPNATGEPKKRGPGRPRKKK